MRLRFTEDVRTLLWAFLLFPLVPLLAYARPGLWPWLVPLALYNSYCAGVLAHNHNHCPVFTGKRWNTLYGSWVSIFYGFPLFAWVPTHNQNHHRYVNGPLDATRTTRHSARNTLWAALTYPLASASWQVAGIRRYMSGSGPGRRARVRRILVECTVLLTAHAGLILLAVHIHGLRLGALVYSVSVGAPALMATYWMMLTNFVQHVECDSTSADDHSRNFTSPFWNWFVFDNGYHTVHHEHPGAHWSRYRALHQARAQRISPEFNVNSPFAYIASAYLRPRRRPSPPSLRAS